MVAPGKKYSTCPYEDCRATRPRTRKANRNLMPEETLNDAGQFELRQCMYCGGAWYIKFETQLPLEYILIGWPDKKDWLVPPWRRPKY